MKPLASVRRTLPDVTTGISDIKSNLEYGWENQKHLMSQSTKLGIFISVRLSSSSVEFAGRQ